MAYANGFTLWNYTTPDALTDVNTAGYFNDIEIGRASCRERV